MTKTDVYRCLSQCKLGVLGSLGPDSQPQSALMGIAVTEALEVVFDTVKSTRKYSNLIARASCSLVMGWDGEQTVQYEGEAAELCGSELERLRAVYFEAWPECRSHLTWPGIVYFVVRPRWLRFSDYDQKPPFIQEFTF